MTSLPDLFGIARESSRRLVLRKHWPRRKGNDGKARVGVPIDAIPADVPPSSPVVDPPPVTVDVTGTLAALEAHIATLRGTVDFERTRADKLEGEVVQLRAVLADMRSRPRWRRLAG